jgi:putative flippase GtrA
MPPCATQGEQVFSWISRMVRRLWREIVGFSAVGLIGVTCDITAFNVVIGVMHAPKVWGSLSGTAIGTIVGYLGNRFWVFRNRELRRSSTEIALYLLVSGVAMGIIAACVAFNEYVLGFKSLIAANVAQFIFGQGLGSVFRFWAMHVWVFPESHKADEAAPPQPPTPAQEPFALEGAAGKAPIL